MSPFVPAVPAVCCLVTAAAALLPGVARAQAVAEAQPRFDVLEYVVEGNSVLEVPAIEQVLMPFMGPGRTMAEVESARAALERAYQSAGWLSVFVDVPEQRVEADGSIVLKVVEGRVDRLSVTGSRYFSQGWIRAKVVEFAEGRVPNFAEAQRQLAIVNRSEQRRVQPVLKPGRAPGTVDVELAVHDELPLEGSIELNNQHAADTKPLRLAAALRYDNLFQRDHALALNLQTAPQAPSQSRVVVANYSVPLDSGRTVSAYALWSDSAVETLGGITALGRGTTLGLRYAIPFAAADGGHSLSFGLDYKDLQQRLVTGAGGGEVSTPLRYLPMQIAYTGNWAEEGRQTQLAVTVVGAARQLLQREVDCPTVDGRIGRVDQFACNHQGADGGFGLLRADLRRTEPLGGGHTLSWRLAGQLATQPLVSGEQFSIGGAETVRGYLESAASGDLGLLGSLQWRSPGVAAWFEPGPGTPAAAGTSPPWWADLAAIAFLDVGRVTVLEPAAGQHARIPLLGSGVGLRLDGRGRVSAAMELAWPHKPLPGRDERSARLHARVAVRF